MKNEIKSLFANTIGTISYLIVIFFFFTLILFLQNTIQDPLKEAWNSSISFLSVLSTLGAAYIASRLFNDWKELEAYNNKKESITKVIEISEKLNNIINDMNLPFAMFSVKRMEKPEFTDFLIETYSNINREKSNLLNNINHLSYIANKGFSSEIVFTDTSVKLDELTDKIENLLMTINDLEYNSNELSKFKNTMEDIKAYINADLIRTLRKGLISY